jgi:hypothetical protein
MFRFPAQVLTFGLATVLLHPAGVRAGEALAIVTGLAPGDLLNVRADASPAGHVKVRLGNGAAVKNSGCSDFNGYSWCKVEVVNQPGSEGWVPARYLLAVDPEGTATAAGSPADGDDGNAAATEPTPQASSPEMEARFGDDAPPGHGQGKTALPGLTGKELDAYRLSLAAQAKAMVTAKNRDGTAQDSVAAPGSVPPADGAPLEDGEGPPPPNRADGEAGLPVPTPRPDPKADADVADTAPDRAPSPETPTSQAVALADPQSPAPAWDATGQIPCARYAGQPMAQCQVGVKRMGAGKADVTVVWPDGGTSVIRFDKGQPASAEPPGKFRFLRESGLNMIRVGASERFEITDKLAFGD